jgi:hypothetical protein
MPDGNDKPCGGLKMITKHVHNWRIYRDDYIEGCAFFDCRGCKSIIHVYLFRITEGYKADVMYCRWLGDRYGYRQIRENQVLCSNRHDRDLDLRVCHNVLGDARLLLNG